jgi:hypothetical protein
VPGFEIVERAFLDTSCIHIEARDRTGVLRIDERDRLKKNEKR